MQIRSNNLLDRIPPNSFYYIGCVQRSNDAKSAFAFAPQPSFETTKILALSPNVYGYNGSLGRIKTMHWKPVYRLVKTIPRGQVATYGQIAGALQLPGGARTAGRAMAACPAGQAIPWHRVVGAGGRLLLRESRVMLQRKLLESEGLRVTERRILDFAKHQWRSKTARRGQSAKK